MAFTLDTEITQLSTAEAVAFQHWIEDTFPEATKARPESLCPDLVPPF
ncbi:hypothetical protein [Pseudonocardia sp. T1-2H]|jgi:hypothetical protein